MGSYRITFEGLNVNRTLKEICASGVTLVSVIRQGKTCTICVPARTRAHVVALLRNKCYNIKQICPVGGAALASYAKKHLVLLLSLVLCIVALGVSSAFCWQIRVTGDYSAQTVLAALKSSGVKVGAPLTGVRWTSVQNAVANELGAMYAIVNRQGSVILVNVVAPKQVDAPIDMHKRRDIVATHSGVVASVLCEQGTALVKPGDVVAKGDVLVQGYRTFEDGTQQEVYALGCVTLELSHTEGVTYGGVVSTLVRTGKTFQNVGVVLFGKQHQGNCPFDQFEVQSHTKTLSPLNLKLTYNTYYQLATQTVAAPMEQCLPQLRQQALDLAMKNCNFDVVGSKVEIVGNNVNATVFGAVKIY